MSESLPVVLIFGGKTGLLGQALVSAAHEQGWAPISLGREDGDPQKQAWLEERIAAIAPAAVINTLAWTQVDLAEDQPDAAMSLNRGMPALLARVLKGSGVPLVHYSTDFVFNGRKESPYQISDATDPLNVYGASKRAGELVLAETGFENCCVIRTAWLFGPGRKNFVRTILDLAKTRETLDVVHDQIGSPTYTPDLAEATFALLRHKATGLFHVVNSGQASWCELAAEAVRLACLPCSIRAINAQDWPQKAKRPVYSVLATDAYTERCGTSMRPWTQALRDYVFKDYLAHVPGCDESR